MKNREQTQKRERKGDERVVTSKRKFSPRTLTVLDVVHIHFLSLSRSLHSLLDNFVVYAREQEKGEARPEGDGKFPPAVEWELGNVELG